MREQFVLFNPNPADKDAGAMLTIEAQGDRDNVPVAFDLAEANAKCNGCPGTLVVMDAATAVTYYQDEDARGTHWTDGSVKWYQREDGTYLKMPLTSGFGK